MRAFVHRPAIRHTTEEANAPVPTGVRALDRICGANATQDLAAEIDKARHAARHSPAEAAMLLRAWMSDHE